ncbi:hypothetical protein EPA93_01630 [Ktedonosporobacter rubrisoli]|uniref:Uncharacterized protein n=1 Tax=Ktedonosporobacter rubrisoli TaxID=2509675 RepID=A0A4P6JIM5_KTERU|nr:hypothetical protein [Ktedonosporobacter rubrisoli]QBD74760.1 hypothetical protein EPA93_01630 [Ktedonosporobacter rubrisoli]
MLNSEIAVDFSPGLCYNKFWCARGCLTAARSFHPEIDGFVAYCRASFIEVTRERGLTGLKETAMDDAIHELKIRAEILHKHVRRYEPHALQRLCALPMFRHASIEELQETVSAIRRRDCLTIIATELGFATWPEARHVLTSTGPVDNFGDLLCLPPRASHLNRWYKGYVEAVEERNRSQGFLLAYRRQYLVVDYYYIEESLGLDPNDADWQELGYDWVHPCNGSARLRLYARLVGNLPRESF